MECTLILIRIFVRDLSRAIEFYTQAVGLEVCTQVDELGWAELDTGACKLALERVAPEAPGEKHSDSLTGRFVGASLAVPDVYASYDELIRRKVEFLSPPERMPWGGVLAHFRDLDGNILTLVGPSPAA